MSRVGVWIVAIILSSASVQGVSAQPTIPNPCPMGQVPFRDVQKTLRALGVDVAQGNYTCGFAQPIDAIVLSGGCQNLAYPTEAYDFLKRRTNRPESISGLNPEFACKLMEFIKKAPGTITISVGQYESKYSVAEKGVAFCQRYSCKEGTNNHAKGCAADLIYNGTCYDTRTCSLNPCGTIQSCLWAHQNAEREGLQYRLMPTHPRFPGFPEPWHIELKDADLTNCKGGPVTPPLPPPSSVPTATPHPASQRPTSPLTSAIRSALGVPPQTPVSPFVPLVPQTPIPVAQSPIPGFMPQSASVSNGQTNINENTNAQKSISEILSELAFGTSSTTSATNTPISVGSTTGGISSTRSASTSSTPHWYPMSRPSTFTSRDITWPYADAAQQGALRRTIAQLRAVFEEMLTMIQSLRGTPPTR